jgi:hypothetical protein
MHICCLLSIAYTCNHEHLYAYTSSLVHAYKQCGPNNCCSCGPTARCPQIKQGAMAMAMHFQFDIGIYTRISPYIVDVNIYIIRSLVVTLYELWIGSSQTLGLGSEDLDQKSGWSVKAKQLRSSTS